MKKHSHKHKTQSWFVLFTIKLSSNYKLKLVIYKKIILNNKIHKLIVKILY